MDKKKAGEKIPYIDKLDASSRARYAEKIATVNGFDPYEASEKIWTTNHEVLPPLIFCDIVNYLLYSMSAYTFQQFKNVKSLEAHMQFTSGWVQELKMFVPENCENTVVFTKVMHSMRLNEKWLLPWVIINRDGEVVSAHCTCMAGLGESCTHVGALLFKVEHMVRVRETPTVTGVPAYWIVPSSVTGVQPEVGYRIDFTSAAAKKKALDKAIAGNQQPPKSLRTHSKRRPVSVKPVTDEEHEDFLRKLHATGDRPVLLSVTKQYCHEYIDPVAPVLVPKSLRTLRSPNCDTMQLDELIAHCDNIDITITAAQSSKMERKTAKQNKCPAWFAARAGRVTASKLHAVCHTPLDKPALSVIKNVCYPGSSKFTTAATQWGTVNEFRARQQYAERQKSHNNFQIEGSCGLFVNPVAPYLGASPDGLVSCNCCGTGTVEIKCPFKHKDATVEEACKDRDFCLSDVDGRFVLKKNHPYFAQVQCQLFCSGRSFCDFVLYTDVDLQVVRVCVDTPFWEDCQHKALLFFKRVVLPEMVAQFFTKEKEDVNPLPVATTSSVKRPMCPPQKSTAVPSKKPKPSKSKTKRQKKNLYCTCRRTEDVEDMVACDNDDCEVQWFHLSCVGLDSEHIPGDEDVWYCPSCVPEQKC